MTDGISYAPQDIASDDLNAIQAAGAIVAPDTGDDPATFAGKDIRFPWWANPIPK